MTRDREPYFIVSCEHASNRIPKRYAKLFENSANILDSHRGLDIGALALAHQVSHTLRAPLFTGEVSRLLIELNRSLNSSGIWSEFSGSLDEVEKDLILRRYYQFYRKIVEDFVERAVRLNLRVVHLSVHTFTPVLDDQPREVDVGILFDPSRSGENAIGQHWIDQLKIRHPDAVVRPNEPYHGCEDGFVPFLRTRFDEEEYVGFELEVKNTLSEKDWEWVRESDFIR